MNPFDYAQNKAYLDGQLALYNFSTAINASAINLPAIFVAKKALRLIKALALSNSKSDAAFVASLGWNISDFMISCFFNGLQCTPNDFYFWSSFEYGNCYTFNYASQSRGDGLKQTSKTGPDNGLSLELFAGFSGILLDFKKLTYYRLLICV